jgi:hypothetical protein
MWNVAESLLYCLALRLPSDLWRKSDDPQNGKIPYDAKRSLMRQEDVEQAFILLFPCRSALLEATRRRGVVYGTLPVRESLLSPYSVDGH